MGVDAEMKVRLRDPLTDDELLTLRAAFREQFPIDCDGDPPYPWIEPERVPLTIAVRMLDRYYGPYYARGDWDHLRAMGDWLAMRFGETVGVRYGSDSGYTDWEHLTSWPEARAECDAHYATVGHLPYWPGCSCAHCDSLRSTTFDLAP